MSQTGEASHAVEDGTRDEYDDELGFKFDDMASLGDEDKTDSEDDEEDSEEDSDSDDQDNTKAISEAVRACLKLFSGFLGVVGSSGASTKSKGIIDERPTEKVEFIKDMERSFNLWIDYTGALAADVNRSLDVRLQGHQDIKGMSVELLQMLTRNLECCVLKNSSTLFK